MKLCSAEKCNSCMACANACPFGAIATTINKYGANQPEIISDKCVECGLCQKVCVEKHDFEFSYPLKAMALYVKSDFDRKTCASGGAATAFSRYVISKGGCVFGATSEGGYPHYIKVDNQNDLELLKGSKYVYCDPLQIYKDVKTELSDDRLCLFIGTPCNVAGLLSLLNKKYSNLITIDLICHGTPPFSYLKEHIENHVGDYSKVANFTFRGKDDFFLTIFDKHGHVIYKQSQYEDEYFMSFMKGFMFRPVCYECQFAQEKRISDITIGDFWNISNDALNGYNGKISVALLNSEKGCSFFNDCKSVFYFEERSVIEAINGNDQLRHPSIYNKERDYFLDYYLKNKSIKKTFIGMGILNKCRLNKFRRYFLYVPKLLRKFLMNIYNNE